MQGMRTVNDPKALVKALRAEKLLVLTTTDNAIRMLPPLIVTEEQIDEAVAIIDKVAGKMAMSANAKKVFALLAFSCLLNFAACSKDTQQAQEQEDQDRQDKEAAEAKAATETWHPKLICPQVAIIHELDTARDYGGAQTGQRSTRSRIAHEELDGEIAAITMMASISPSPWISSPRVAPRLSGRNSEFPFFVAVVDPDGNILNKNMMTEQFHFKEDDKTVERTDSLHVFIPMPKDKHSTGPHYRVLAGFQLTEDQLKQVRSAENKAETAAQTVTRPAIQPTVDGHKQ